MVEGKTRVVAGQIGGRCVPFQPRGEFRERVGEAPQERDHLLWREQVFHHHEAHQVQAEIARDRGGFHWSAQPALVGGAAGSARSR